MLLVRPLWRRVFGPAAVLWPWLLVPALVLAVSVPRPARVIEAAAVDRSPPTRLESAVTPSTVASDASRSPIATGPSEVAALRDRLRPQAYVAGGMAPPLPAQVKRAPEVAVDRHTGKARTTRSRAKKREVRGRAPASNAPLPTAVDPFAARL